MDVKFILEMGKYPQSYFSTLFIFIFISYVFFFSEEKAKLLRDVMAKIESKNETLE